MVKSSVAGAALYMCMQQEGGDSCYADRSTVEPISPQSDALIAQQEAKNPLEHQDTETAQQISITCSCSACVLQAPAGPCRSVVPRPAVWLQHVPHAERRRWAPPGAARPPPQPAPGQIPQLVAGHSVVAVQKRGTAHCLALQQATTQFPTLL